MRVTHTQDFLSEKLITLWQEGEKLWVGPATERDEDKAETALIESVTPSSITIKGKDSSTLYQISGAAFWRACNGGSAEPDQIWAGVMEAAAAKLRQDAQEMEDLLMNSTPIKLTKREMPCAFCKPEEGRSMTNLLHITEDLRRPGAYVVLPICTSCQTEQMNAKFTEPSSSVGDEERKPVVYQIDAEG